MKTLFRNLTPVLALIASTSNAWALATTLPPCLDHGQELSVNDAQVAQWKVSTANQFLARAHVKGTIHQLFPDHSGHNHFEIQMDTPTGDTLEVVYSQAFGALPTLHPGMIVEACGDYITSKAATGRYPASPDGAIIHWIHNNQGGGSSSGFLPMKHHRGGGGNGNQGGGHEAGYLVIDGQVYGGY